MVLRLKKNKKTLRYNINLFKYALIIWEDGITTTITSLVNIMSVMRNEKYTKNTDILNLRIQDSVKSYDPEARELVEGKIYAFGIFILIPL